MFCQSETKEALFRLAAKREAGETPARSRRCKRETTLLMGEIPVTEDALWEDEQSGKVHPFRREPEDLHNCDDTANGRLEGVIKTETNSEFGLWLLPQSFWFHWGKEKAYCIPNGTLADAGVNFDVDRYSLWEFCSEQPTNTAGLTHSRRARNSSTECEGGFQPNDWIE